MLVIDGTFGQMIRNNIHHLNNERIFNLLTNNGLYKLSINTLDSRLLSVLGIEQNILPLVNRAPGYFITLPTPPGRCVPHLFEKKHKHFNLLNLFFSPDTFQVSKFIKTSVIFMDIITDLLLSLLSFDIHHQLTASYFN